MSINEMEFLGAIADYLELEANRQSTLNVEHVVFDRSWVIRIAGYLRTIGVDTDAIERSARSNGRAPESVREHERGAWKRYPIKIPGLVPSGCCGKPSLLVQSMDGGFVTRNCSACANFSSLDKGSFELIARHLWVQCPACKARMVQNIIDKNYGFQCPRCPERVLPSELLPWWHQLI